MNIILGSGIVGLLAKSILGSSWKIIPFRASRLYSFNPAVADNFITRNEEVDQFIGELCGPKPVYAYKRAWSVGGQIVSAPNDDLCRDWVTKIFGNDAPPQSELCYKKLVAFVYDIKVNQLYQSLLSRYIDELRSEAKKGDVTEIGDHYIVRGAVREEFDNAISTIPLDVLYKLRGSPVELPAIDLHLIHIASESLDFEGNNQLLVVDRVFSFFKVTNIAPHRYLIYCHEEIHNPGIYLMSIIKSLDILDGTTLERGLPAGPPPKLDAVEKCGIYCVGGYAQWDWCMDVSSCILRLLRYANFGMYRKSKEIPR